MSSGENILLPECEQRFHAVVGWSDPEGGHAVDLSALLLTKNRTVRSDRDMVFYNQPASVDGAVRHLGNTPSDAGAEARIAIDLESLASEVDAIGLVASIEGGTFGTLADLRLTVLGSSGADVARFDIAAASTETAFHFGELYRRDEKWRFRAVGQGWDSGLAGIATDFGIAIATDESTEETVQSEAPAEQAVPAEAPALEPKAAKPVGVRTKRIKPIRLAPSMLADDASWQSARLFSISGVGVAAEQEKRATSALLSTMVAVRRFGRAVAAHLGAPSGPMETFLEVQFTLGEETVIPDGLIRVARGGKMWTALVEAKTGTGQLRSEQVEHYLDVARERGYDAVVTISNEIAPSAGVHPVPVDGRRLKKVSLHHLSWAEVLHEARMVLLHRGVEDQLQAWVLNEFIRYLTHVKSGAVGFTDMGSAWVPVREAVAAGTLRASDRKVPAVAEAWARLVRHLALQLTADLGVPVVQVLPRGTGAEPAALLQSAAAQLASDGTLDATLRVPDAAGFITVLADLRTSKVAVSVDILAPREGGSKRRVGWLLRQLKDAPDKLIVEARFSGQADSTCEQLKDVRDNIPALLVDRVAEIRSFRLTMVTPLGTKRSGVKSAFVPSVTTAVESMYRSVVQPIRPWTPPAPSLPAETGSDEVGDESPSAV